LISSPSRSSFAWQTRRRSFPPRRWWPPPRAADRHAAPLRLRHHNSSHRSSSSAAQEEGRQRRQWWPLVAAATARAYSHWPMVLLLPVGIIWRPGRVLDKRRRPLDWHFGREHGMARSGAARTSSTAGLHRVRPTVGLHAASTVVPAAARTYMGPGGSHCGAATDAAAGLLFMGDGLGRLQSHALLGCYTSLSLTCFACFYVSRQ